MKPQAHSWILAIGMLLSGGSACRSPQNSESAPSTNRVVYWLIPNSALLAEKSDLRCLICDGKILQDRIRRGVCVIDRRAMADTDIEVPVSGKTSVREAFQRAGILSIPRSQIRLLTKDSITQTPLPRSKNRIPSIWDAEVEPGDIIVLPPQQ